MDAVEEAVVNVYLFSEPATLFPLAPFDGGSQVSLMMYYDHLVRLNPAGEIIGSLAESWEVEDDGQTWIIHLKPDITWQDGEPFTAEDVVFSFNRYANPQAGSAHSGFFSQVVGAEDVVDGITDEVSGFSAPDELTLRVELTTANVAWLTPFAREGFWIMPEHILGEVPVEEFEANEFWANPTDGLGPYNFVRWLPDQFIEFERNPGYRAPVEVNRVFLKLLTDDVAVSQLGTGEVDIAKINPLEVETVEAMDGVNVLSSLDMGFVRMGFNLDKERFQDPRVRQAFHYAVDRQRIVDEVLRGFGEVLNNVIMTDWALPDDQNSYPYEPDTARQLLDEAGFNFDEPVVIIAPNPSRDRADAALVVQAQLGEIGVNVEIQNVEAAQWQEMMNPDLHDGVPPFDLTLFGGGNYPPDPTTIRAVTTCENEFPNGFNIAYCRPEVDRLIVEADTEPDFDARAALYQEVARVLNEDLSAYYLYRPAIAIGVNERVSGFVPHGAQSSLVWNAQEWAVEG